MSSKSINDLSHELIGAAVEVHRELGPGLLESAYEGAYAHELTLRGLPHVRQINFNVRKLVDGVERVSHRAPNLSARSASSAFQYPTV